MTDLSIVVPVCNEARRIATLWVALSDVLAAIVRASEVLFVDDGSVDGSVDLIGGLCAADRRVRLVRLAEHAGTSAALDAAFARVRGRVLVVLEDPAADPRVIPSLLAELAHADVAVARDRGVFTMRRSCLEAVDLYSGMHAFVPSLLSAGLSPRRGARPRRDATLGARGSASRPGRRGGTWSTRGSRDASSAVVCNTTSRKACRPTRPTRETGRARAERALTVR